MKHAYDLSIKLSTLVTNCMFSISHLVEPHVDRIVWQHQWSLWPASIFLPSNMTNWLLDSPIENAWLLLRIYSSSHTKCGTPLELPSPERIVLLTTMEEWSSKPTQGSQMVTNSYSPGVQRKPWPVLLLRWWLLTPWVVRRSDDPYVERCGCHC